jgi:hypothetical protein
MKLVFEMSLGSQAIIDHLKFTAELQESEPCSSYALMQLLLRLNRLFLKFDVTEQAYEKHQQDYSIFSR